jgi:hypothetical protein
MRGKLRASARICAAAAALLLACVHADEEAEIVTACHFANAEWGNDMIDRCVKENQATRALVLAYPPQHQRIVNRCRAKSELGWAWVKNCVDRDIAAESALAQYPKEKADLIATCRTEFAPLGAARVKGCVDGAGEAPRNN